VTTEGINCSTWSLPLGKNKREFIREFERLVRDQSEIFHRDSLDRLCPEGVQCVSCYN
jgi:hypothetical protein